MVAYVVYRVLMILPLLWAIATITFFLMHAVPGGPFTSERPVPESVQAALNARYDLDRPIWEQYWLYLWSLLHLDLGLSFRGDRSVAVVISEGIFVSTQLGVTAFVYATVVGVAMGTLGAFHHNRFWDRVATLFATIGAAVPSFIIATFLVIIFSVKLGWTDVLGWEFGNPRKMALPVVALGTLSAAYLARITRASVLEVLNQDHVRAARSKGLPEAQVALRHVLRNALIPVVTVLGPIFVFLVTGSFIVEKIFAINGIGRYYADAVLSRDYGMIMGTTLFYACLVCIANLVVDITYVFLDPRIRYR